MQLRTDNDVVARTCTPSKCLARVNRSSRSKAWHSWPGAPCIEGYEIAAMVRSRRAWGTRASYVAGAG